MIKISRITIHIIALFVVTHSFAQQKLSCSNAKTDSSYTNTAIIPVQKLENDFYDWHKRHKAIVGLIKEKQVDLVFIGDSITHMFGGAPKSPIIHGKDVWDQYYGSRNAINMGFGWDRTQNVLWRIENGELNGISPKVAVILIGTNNQTGTKNARKNTPEEIAEGVTSICKAIHKKIPNCKILLLGVLPRAPGHFVKPIKEVNRLLIPLAKLDYITLLDMYEKFADKNGLPKKELMHSDGVHPNAKGYQVWAETMEPILEKLMNGKTVMPRKPNEERLPKAEITVKKKMTVADNPPVPKIIPEWTKIAGNSDSSPESEVVDHCFWKAANGKWRAWTQIRNTTEGRIFSQWAGSDRLIGQWENTPELWKGKKKHGETPGVVQAPHVYRAYDTYYMTYGGGGQICLATSEDGVTFKRQRSPSRFISELKNRTPSGIRDPYMTKIGDRYRTYFTKENTISMVEADRPDSKLWSKPIIVYQNKESCTQCPTVIQHEGWFYLFCMGLSNKYQTQVLASRSPDDFGVDSNKQIAILQTSASEILRDDDKWYISSLIPIRNKKEKVIGHGGVRIAPLKWVKK